MPRPYAKEKAYHVEAPNQQFVEPYDEGEGFSFAHKPCNSYAIKGISPLVLMISPLSEHVQKVADS
jgi:hypothetical protein